jgi:hypothetical protein
MHANCRRKTLVEPPGAPEQGIGTADQGTEKVGLSEPDLGASGGGSKHDVAPLENGPPFCDHR